ncbi:hypothetical protein HRbin36_00895 [bacterium HR36]|nr:hypothetical protein HRbin36_00895 [bacterium HR36]
MFLGQFAAHVVSRELIHVHAHHFQFGETSSLVVETFENFANNHVSVRVEAIFGNDSGYAIFPFHVRSPSSASAGKHHHYAVGLFA